MPTVWVRGIAARGSLLKGGDAGLPASIWTIQILRDDQNAMSHAEASFPVPVWDRLSSLYGWYCAGDQQDVTHVTLFPTNLAILGQIIVPMRQLPCANAEIAAHTGNRAEYWPYLEWSDRRKTLINWLHREFRLIVLIH